MGSFSNNKLTTHLHRHAKRMPGLVSLVLFMLLCACTTYWIMQLVKPPSRTVAAPPQEDAPKIDISQAAGLFGGSGAVAVVASNYQLLGVVVAQNPVESVVILSANGKPAQSIRIGKEVLPGVSIREVHQTYVLVSEGGVLKRLILPERVQIKQEMALPVPAAAPTMATPATPAVLGDLRDGAVQT